MGEPVHGLGAVPDGWRLAGREGSVLSRDCARFVTVDPAATEKDSSDFTAMLAAAVTPAGELLVLEVVRERLALDAIVPRLARLCRRWRPQWVGLEAVGFQGGLVLEAQKDRDVPTAVRLEPEGKGKLVRATPAVLLAEGGRLYLPDAAPWLEDFEAELALFTGDDKRDAHDDQVDALAYAVLMARSHYGTGDSDGLGSTGGWKGW
jgi:predicted phage terminase large subunit-like protein